MPYTIHLEQVSGRPTAVVRRRAQVPELPKVVPEACGVVWKIIRTQHVQGAGRNLAVYLDEQINLEVGVEIDGPFAGHGEVVRSATPGGRVVTTTHFGPYPLLKHAHEAIRQWCRDNGHALAGPNWEIYGHWQEAWNREPEKILTDVFYLLV